MRAWAGSPPFAPHPPPAVSLHNRSLQASSEAVVPQYMHTAHVAHKSHTRVDYDISHPHRPLILCKENQTRCGSSLVPASLVAAIHGTRPPLESFANKTEVTERCRAKALRRVHQHDNATVTVCAHRLSRRGRASKGGQRKATTPPPHAWRQTTPFHPDPQRAGND